MIVHIKKVIAAAQKGKFAIGAFNTSNLEMTLGIIRGAVKAKSPVIIQISESTIKYAGLENIIELINQLAKTDGKSIPIAIHLDHGKDFELVKGCVRAGISSVHMDASEFPYEQNIAITKKAVAYAHKFGVYCQAELGAMIGKEGMTKIKLPKNPDEYMTNPAQVKDFVKRTGVDTLAVSVGTLHGHFQGKEKIDLPRVKKINQEIPNVPLVLHGASGSNPNEVQSAIGLGVRIINIDTDLRIAFTKTLRATLKTLPKNFYDPRKALGPSIDAVSRVVEEKIAIFGSGQKR
jgi:fructose-bisphosphate aldolase class II